MTGSGAASSLGALPQMLIRLAGVMRAEDFYGRSRRRKPVFFLHRFLWWWDFPGPNRHLPRVRSTVVACCVCTGWRAVLIGRIGVSRPNHHFVAALTS